MRTGFESPLSTLPRIDRPRGKRPQSGIEAGAHPSFPWDGLLACANEG
jgi:hypothetical protein